MAVMDHQIERRRRVPPPDEELSPDEIALIALCGGEIRKSDWEAIARSGMQAHVDRIRSERKRGQEGPRRG